MKKVRFMLFVLFLMLPFTVNARLIKIQPENQDVFEIEVETSDTVEFLKADIEVEKGIAVEFQKLMFGDLVLEEGRTLADYNIQAGDTVYLYIIAYEEKYEVVFDANGGTFGDSDKYVVDEWKNELYDNLIVPTRSGYKFVGYFTERTGGTKLELILAESGIDADLTFYAHWEEEIIIPENEEENDKREEENPETSNKTSIISIIAILSFITMIISIVNLNIERIKELM